MMETLKQLFAPFTMLVITSGITFVASTYWFNKKAKADAVARKLEADAELRKKVAELERQLTTISSSVQPLNAAYQAMLIKQLTHFHTPVLDGYLSKLDPFTLTREEEEHMHIELEKRSKEVSGDDVPPEEHITDSERDAAIMLPMVIKRVREENNAEKELKIVSVEKGPDAKVE